MPYRDVNQSSEQNDPNYVPGNIKKMRSFKNHFFEKNFPKNVIISMIKFLRIMGGYHICEDLNIIEKDIQSKNSASLEDIYRILSHQKMILINKRSLEQGTSLIILQNSKISKKGFHLRIIRNIFSFEIQVGSQDCKQFRDFIYQKAE